MASRKLKRTESISSVKTEEACEDFIEASPNGLGGKRGRKESEQKRRVLMNHYFDELNALLTMLSDKDIPKKMDKVATLRETINCLQVYYHTTSFCNAATENLPTPPTAESSVKPPLLDLGETLKFLLDSQDAFLILISEAGRILYSTELITSQLGYIQSYLIGQNWFDYVHSKDHEAYQQLFSFSEGDQPDHIPYTTIKAHPSQTCKLRLKLCDGETGGLPQYLSFSCLSYVRKWSSNLLDFPPPSPEEMSLGLGPIPEEQLCNVLIGKLPTSLTLVDLAIGTNDVNFEFDMRVSQEGRIIHVDKHAVLVLGFNIPELIGTSFFDYVDPFHAMDAGEGILSFISTGVGTTTPYRLRTKSGRYVWLISKGYTSYNPWINKPDHILLTNRILGSDQVLPEHRFYRSRSFLPDLDGEEYSISSSEPASSVVKATHSCAPTYSESHRAAVSQPQAQSSSFLASKPVPDKFSHSLPSFNKPPSNGTLPPSVPYQAPSSFSQSVQPSFSVPACPLPTAKPSSLTMSMAQHTQTAPFVTQPSDPSPNVPQDLINVQKELERKNCELFEMQRRLLEQQHLFEQERNQFYQVSKQVMQCITAPAARSSTFQGKTATSLPSFISQGSLPSEPKMFNITTDEVKTTTSDFLKWNSSLFLNDPLLSVSSYNPPPTPHNPFTTCGPPTSHSQFSSPTSHIPFTSRHPSTQQNQFIANNPQDLFNPHPHDVYSSRSMRLPDPSPSQYAPQHTLSPAQEFMGFNSNVTTTLNQTNSSLTTETHSVQSQSAYPLQSGRAHSTLARASVSHGNTPRGQQSFQSLSMLNDNLMSSLGLPTMHGASFGPTQSQTVSQIQALSDMFGGHLNSN